jgi:hypothetical protein
VIGFAVVGLIELIGLLALNAIGDARAWPSYDLRLGPILAFAYERSARGTAVTFGTGVFLLALLGGVLNAGGAAMLRDRV